MKQYLDLVKKVLAEGKIKHNRTGIDTITIPHYHLQHDMSDGSFPLLTTKKMAMKTMLVELEGFLRGITSKNWYKERGCNVWNEWANPKKIPNYMNDDCRPVHIDTSPENIADRVNTGELRKLTKEEVVKYQASVDDLGPIYGYQWRKFDAPYEYGQELGHDQLREILYKLKNNPNDRRMVCSAWNPRQIPEMALPPCATQWHVTVIDGMLGIPFDLASSATLLLLLCKYSGLQPGYVSGFLSDVHIYVNHIEGAKEQIRRIPKELPSLEILGEPFYETKGELIKWTHEDLLLTGYYPHPKIQFDIAI
jgi:thymidylate synthase